MRPLKVLKILKTETLEKIFSNLEDLYEQHETFYQELEEESKKSEDEISFGQCFLSKDGFFEKYSIYVNNYDSALEVIKEELASNSEFKSFIQTCEGKQECKGNPIGSFLILPIQRIPRYLLYFFISFFKLMYLFFSF